MACVISVLQLQLQYMEESHLIDRQAHVLVSVCKIHFNMDETHQYGVVANN